MKSRHSIEAKAMIEQRKMNRSRFNPESPVNMTADSGRCVKIMKRSESSSTLQVTDTQISLIEDRYRLLEQDYRNLLKQTKSKGQLFRKQKLDLELYRTMHKKNSKEIQRLRSLIGFVKKSEICTQTDYSQILNCTEKIHYSVSKQRRSPLIGKATLANRDSWQGSRVSLKKVNSRLKQEEGKGQYNKYKFVPSLPLH